MDNFHLIPAELKDRRRFTCSFNLEITTAIAGLTRPTKKLPAPKLWLMSLKLLWLFFDRPDQLIVIFCIFPQTSSSQPPLRNLVLILLQLLLNPLFFFPNILLLAPLYSLLPHSETVIYNISLIITALFQQF